MPEPHVHWRGAVTAALGAARALGLGLAVMVFASAAQAQLTCTPATPRTDPGTGFVPFGANEQALARGGNAGPAWEWAIGTDTEGGQKTQGSLDWVSGKLYAWTLAYSGAGAASLEVRDQGALVLSVTYPSSMDAGNALQFQVSTNPSIGATTTIAASVATINGFAVNGAISQTGNNQAAEQNLYYFFPGMAAGFTATGTVSLTYASLPSGSRVQFLARAGNIACAGGNNAPTVSISAPASGSVFNAPASIAVAANATDSDGTVTLVEFFANGSPIGTASSLPFTINWAGVAAGAYGLTARATDNGGATTASAAVAITVNAAPMVAITAPAAGATFIAPATIAVTAGATDADGTITQVAFYANGIPIGTATTSPFTINWTNAAAGAYSLTAVATDNQGAMTTSAAVPITVSAPVAKLYFVHSDHLNSPRQVYDEHQQLRWRWDQAEPFGASPAEENPAAIGAFEFNLRFRGQYFDKETNTHYNYFRDYDPSLGIYKQSDPIGLKAGLNTYAYVQGQPVTRVDPFGLLVLMLPPGISERGANTVACNGTGGFQILLEDPGSDPCWVDCLRAHEQVHVSDFMRIDPNVCAGAANRQAINVMSNNLVWIFELRGYEEELRCLRDTLKQSCTGGPCDPKVRERVRDVEGIIRDMRNTGRVPQQ